jgi:hypothetical protein
MSIWNNIDSNLVKSTIYWYRYISFLEKKIRESDTEGTRGKKKDDPLIISTIQYYI